LALPFAASDNTSNYGDDYGSDDVPDLAPDAIVTGTGSASYLNGDDVVYAYTPDADGIIDITLSNTGTWVGLWVFSGCPFASTLGVHTGSDSNGRAIEGLPVVAGETYYIVISTFPSPQSTAYDLNIEESAFDCPNLEADIGDPCDDGNPDTFDDVVTENCTCEGTPVDCPGLGNFGDPCDDGDPGTVGSTVQDDCSCGGGIPIPANDDCSGATVLLCGETLDGTTLGASESGLDAECNGFTSPSPEDVWYSFEAQESFSYTVTVDPNGSDIDAVLFVYSGDCGQLVDVACADDGFIPGTGEQLILSDLEPGTYYVRVFNWVAGGESFQVSLDCEFVCQDPFPAVDDNSLNATITGNSVILSWDPVPFSIGCQLQGRKVGSTNVLSVQALGFEVSEKSFSLSNLEPASTYRWRVRCGCSTDPLVVGEWSAPDEFNTPGLVAISTSPNPTEGQSFVTFEVMEEAYATLEVIDMNGRTIAAVFSGMAQPNNEYRFEFDGSDLPNGVYIYRLTTENEIVNEKFMIAR
jgi:hypothetical protein